MNKHQVSLWEELISLTKHDWLLISVAVVILYCWICIMLA